MGGLELSRLKEQQSQKRLLLLLRPPLKPRDRLPRVGDGELCLVRREIAGWIVVGEVSQFVEMASDSCKVSNASQPDGWQR